MNAIEISELQAHLVEVLRQVQEEGQAIDITNDGRVVARVVPVGEPSSDRRDAVWRNMERLSEELSHYLPADVDAVEAIRDIRREL